MATVCVSLLGYVSPLPALSYMILILYQQIHTADLPFQLCPHTVAKYLEITDTLLIPEGYICIINKSLCTCLLRYLFYDPQKNIYLTNFDTSTAFHVLIVD